MWNKARVARFKREQEKDRDFCRECGAKFPPKEGEGHCVTWEQCRDGQKKERESQLPTSLPQRRKTDTLPDPGIMVAIPPISCLDDLE